LRSINAAEAAINDDTEKFRVDKNLNISAARVSVLEQQSWSASTPSLVIQAAGLWQTWRKVFKHTTRTLQKRTKKCTI
jgi:hypothetical protein